MGPVATLATIFAILGWLAIVFFALLVVFGGVLTAQVFRSPQAGQLVAGLLAPYLLYALVPFLAWGLLRGLCELHAQGERQLEALDDLRRAGRAAPAGQG